MFLSSFLNALNLPLVSPSSQLLPASGRCFLLPNSTIESEHKSQIKSLKSHWPGLSLWVSKPDLLWLIPFFPWPASWCETLVGTSSLIAWWESILEMLDSVVACCFPPSVLRDWFQYFLQVVPQSLQTCLLFQPVFQTDLLKWPLPYSVTDTPLCFPGGAICSVWQNLRSLTSLWSQLVSDSFFHAYLFCFLLSLSQLSVSLKLFKHFTGVNLFL